MTLEQLQNDGWAIKKTFHNDECYYYWTAEKGRNILFSDSGAIFSGLLDGQWV